jgi:glyoxylase I family protein
MPCHRLSGDVQSHMTRHDFMKHLDEQSIPYSDWGSDAVKGWHQVFFYDPEGNVIEVHQIVSK